MTDKNSTNTTPDRTNSTTKKRKSFDSDLENLEIEIDS